MPRLAIPIVTLTLLAGCTFAGEFSLKHVDRLQIGKLKSSEYKELFGGRPETESRTTPDGRFERAQYAHMEQGFGGDCVRMLWLEFRDGLLNAFLLADSCEAHTQAHTEIAVGLMPDIGKLGKREVLERMGNPTGQARCPSVLFERGCEEAVEIWLWIEPGTRDLLGDRTATAGTFASFDAQGMLADVQTFEL